MMKIRSACLVLAALLLASCSLGGKAPDLLLTLTPKAALSAQGGAIIMSAEAVTVVRPSAPQALATTRVLVTTGQAVTYLKDAYWVDTPANLFQRLLSETIAAQTGRIVLDPLQPNVSPGIRLTGQLQNFGLDSSAMEVVVTYDAVLVRNAGALTSRRFEAREPVSVANRSAVASALNKAANRVATEVSTWIGGS
jgi:cholesterol transport system auxiliary component